MRKHEVATSEAGGAERPTLRRIGVWETLSAIYRSLSAVASIIREGQSSSAS